MAPWVTQRENQDGTTYHLDCIKKIRRTRHNINNAAKKNTNTIGKSSIHKHTRQTYRVRVYCAIAQAELPWQISWYSQTAECRRFESHPGQLFFQPWKKELSLVQLTCQLFCLCIYLLAFLTYGHLLHHGYNRPCTGMAEPDRKCTQTKQYIAINIL